VEAVVHLLDLLRGVDVDRSPSLPRDDRCEIIRRYRAETVRGGADVGAVDTADRLGACLPQIEIEIAR
jgi:hypothetical protein